LEAMKGSMAVKMYTTSVEKKFISTSAALVSRVSLLMYYDACIS